MTGPQFSAVAVSGGEAAAALLALSRPTVLAALTRSFRDLDLAEDACQEAAARALATWPERGIPKDPTGWLIRTGHNAGLDGLRRRARERPEAGGDPVPDDPSETETGLVETLDLRDLRDDVLRLMFMCCHPQLGVTDQLALALKVIGGFSVAQIARAFVVAPKAMEQRITRAKKRAAATATRLETPSLAERAERLDQVCLMVYLMFNEGYSAGGGNVHIKLPLCEEAIRLARLLLTLFPGQPEVMGGLALYLLQHARHRARIDETGALVPLDKQDRTLWDKAMIAEARVLLEKALRHGRPGRYQIQAAIAAVHASAPTAETTDWPEIVRLYTALDYIQPSPVVTLNKAVAVWKTQGAAAALDIVEPLEASLSGYLYFHTTRAALLAEAGRPSAAEAAYRAALDLRPTDAERDHILQKIADL